MKTTLRALLLALPLLAAATEAQAAGCGKFFCFNTDCGFGIGFKSHGDCCGPQFASPWYTYWPYHAHFAAPAHPEFPYWPAPMTSMAPGPMEPPSPPYMPQLQPTHYQPVGYYGQPPSYWYGR